METWKSFWTNKVLPHWIIFHSLDGHIDITVWSPQSFPVSLEVASKALSAYISRQPLPATTFHTEWEIEESIFPSQQLLKALLRHKYLLSTVWSNYYQWNCKHCFQISPPRGMGAKSLRPVFFNHFYFFLTKIHF